MAVETTYSPRISFSYNVCQQGPQASFDSRVQESIPLDSSVEFEFSVCESSDFENSSADDLFYNGRILAIGPTRMTRNFPSKMRIEPTAPLPISSTAPQARAATGPALTRLVETMEEPDVKQMNRHTFWQFVRSRSSSAASSSKSPSLCFFPLMPRSQSTGSKSSPSKTSNLLEKNNYKRPSPLSPPNKKSFGSRNGQSNGRSAPALNVPLADIFGFASLCLNRKCKNKA